MIIFGKTKKTVIFMGYKCNNKCIFCCNDDKRSKNLEKTTSEVKDDVKSAKKSGTTYIEFIGGEPTIRTDFIEILRFAKYVGFETIMFASNGRALSNLDFAKKILDSGVNHIVFSIHGHKKEIHDALTKVPGSFEQTIKGLENVKSLGLTDIGSNTTIVKQNYIHLEDIGSFIYDLGIRNSEFIFVDPTNGAPKYRFEELVPTYGEVSPYVNGLLEFGKLNEIEHWHIRYYPLCFIDEKYHDMVSELHEQKFFETKHLAPDFVNRDYLFSRKNDSKIKLEKCKKCVYCSVCEGYWKEYVRRRPGNI